MCDFVAGDFKSWNDVVSALGSNAGVVTCTMEALRDIDGYGRLGVSVRANIERKLGTLGVTTIREELPKDAAAPVVLIRQGTPVSELIETLSILQAGGGSVQEISVSLRRLNTVPDPASVKASIDVAFAAIQACEVMMEAGPNQAQGVHIADLAETGYAVA